MDGPFVPSSTIGLLIVEAIRPVTSLPVNIHWMIDNPDTYIEIFADAGADIISVHVEAAFSAWHTAYNEKVQKARVEVERRIGIGRSAVIWRITNKGVRLYRAHNTRHMFYPLLGFRAPEYIQEKIEEVYPMGTVVTWIPTSPEQVRRNRSDLM